jgi:hypothetical protein
VVIIVQEDGLIGSDLRWPLRIAKQRDADITLLALPPKTFAKGMRRVDLSASAEQTGYEKTIAERTRVVLDEYLGPEQWTRKRPESGGEAEEAGADSQGIGPLVEIVFRNIYLVL